MAWMAGLFDGEGTIRIQYEPRTEHGNGSLEVRISITDRQLLEPFQRAWGGKVRKAGVRPEAEERGWKQPWIWTVYARPAADFLGALYPYFRSTRSISRTELGLKYQSLKNRYHQGWGSSKRRNEKMQIIRAELSALNKRGK